MYVFVAHSGRVYSLFDSNVDGSTSVSAVQQLLFKATGIPEEDQILIADGIRLEPQKPLATYKLPAAEESQTGHVFLYSKLMLRSDDVAAMHAGETRLHNFSVDEPVIPERTLRHPLEDYSGSAFVRELPACEHRMRHVVAIVAQYVQRADAVRSACSTLYLEMTVQDAAIKMALANMRVHRDNLHESFNTFVKRRKRQAERHESMLQSFDADLQLLRRCELHAALQTPTLRHVSDLLTPQQLQRHDDCRRRHDSFNREVADLQGAFDRLMQSVEELCSADSPVDLEQLRVALGDDSPPSSSDTSSHHAGSSSTHAAGVHAIADAVQMIAAVQHSMQRDFEQVQGMVESAVRTYGSNAAALQSMSDDAEALIEKCAHHEHAALPATRRAFNDELLPSLKRFEITKKAMTAHVVATMQHVSRQQSGIAQLKKRVKSRASMIASQDHLFNELQLLQRTPVCYKRCLAECIRRRAWADQHSMIASRLAEDMSKRCERELERRMRFQQDVEWCIPRDMLAAMGLNDNPAACEVSMHACDTRVLQLLPSDLPQLQSESWLACSSPYSAVPSSPPYTPSNGDDGGTDELARLKLENAHLRSSLADEYARRCMLALEMKERQNNKPMRQPSFNAAHAIAAVHRIVSPDASPLPSSAGSSMQPSPADVAGDREASMQIDPSHAALCSLQQALQEKEKVIAQQSDLLRSRFAEVQSMQAQLQQLQRAAVLTSPSSAQHASLRSADTGFAETFPFSSASSTNASSVPHASRTTRPRSFGLQPPSQPQQHHAHAAVLCTVTSDMALAIHHPIQMPLPASAADMSAATGAGAIAFHAQQTQQQEHGGVGTDDHDTAMHSASYSAPCPLQPVAPTQPSSPTMQLPATLEQQQLPISVASSLLTASVLEARDAAVTSSRVITTSSRASSPPAEQQRDAVQALNHAAALLANPVRHEPVYQHTHSFYQTQSPPWPSLASSMVSSRGHYHDIFFYGSHASSFTHHHSMERDHGTLSTHSSIDKDEHAAATRGSRETFAQSRPRVGTYCSTGEASPDNDAFQPASASGSHMLSGLFGSHSSIAPPSSAHREMDSQQSMDAALDSHASFDASALDPHNSLQRTLSSQASMDVHMSGQSMTSLHNMPKPD